MSCCCLCFRLLVDVVERISWLGWVFLFGLLRWMLLVLGFGYGCFVWLLRYAFGRCCVFVWFDLAGSGVLIMWVVG